VRAAALDRRVRKEARELVRAARAALLQRKGLQGKAGDLETVTRDVEDGLAGKDLVKVRHNLPLLDALCDELIKRAPKSTTRDYFESIGAAVLIALCLRAFVIEAFKIPSSSMYPTLEIGDHIFVNKFIYGVRIPWTNTKLFELRGPKRGEVIVFMQPCMPDKDYIKRVVATAGDTVEVRCNVLYVNGAAVPSKLLEGEGCQYDDYEESTGRWFPKSCSKYEETVDGKAYETYQDEKRPAREQQLAQGTLDHGDSHDFPLHDRPIIPPSCATSPGEPDSMAAPNQRPGKVVETKTAEKAGVCEQQLHYVVPEGHIFAMGDNRSNSNDSRYWGSVPIENIKGKALFIWLSYAHWGFTDWTGIRWPRIGNFVK